MKSFQHSLVGFDFDAIAANLLEPDRGELARLLEGGLAVESIAVFIHEAYARKLAAEAEAELRARSQEAA
jgi:hypothetical protein